MDILGQIPKNLKKQLWNNHYESLVVESDLIRMSLNEYTCILRQVTV